MGWTSFQFDGTREEFLRDEFGSYYNIIDFAVVGSVIYAALQRKTDDKKHIFAAVILTNRRNGEFAYKDMDESVGPCECKCPKRIINKLTPLEELYDDQTSFSYQYSKEWREKCLNPPKKAKTVKVEPGTIIKTKDPLKFTTGEFQYFKLLYKSVWAVVHFYEDTKQMIVDSCYKVKFRPGRFEHDIIPVTYKDGKPVLS